MNLKKIKVSGHEVAFTQDENIWLCSIEQGDSQIEIIIDIEKYSDEIDWEKVQNFSDHFFNKKKEYLKICIEPLKMLAKATTFFTDKQLKGADFLLSGIEILDNQLSLAGWTFELVFEMSDDPYGLWHVTFQENHIVGLRREQQ